MSAARAETILDASADQAWQLVESRHPGLARPAVDRVRTVSHADWAPTQERCMTAAGFPQAKAMPDASLVSGQVPEDQSEPFAVAEYTCGAEYPMAAKYQTAFNESQLEWLYRYSTGELAKCLQDRGISVERGPSEQEFIDSDGAWSPYRSVGLPQSRYYELVTACPEIPDSIYG
ncbi:hypothetical protein [Curtobacterium flaccumfaciens]|uniref:hypothetical protein n=1 Tax=Curtobacterium flaccumfaciens TaxID=2035 RepID=UPI001BE06A3B|nr:hypothetical protein [Curtobacterium flaccumfaciens]MBT1585245.1 hypothetical protein [Curtobacterium flaccumfaciens pv. flaccumfaciens]MCX2798207.1 hypothetical protein [Curtobacterium flaccumfaciens pv. flaccumfaciens]